MNNPFDELSKLQVSLGYVANADPSPVALLGVFGEAGEILEAYLWGYAQSEAASKSVLWEMKDAVSAAQKVDAIKKSIRDKSTDVEDLHPILSEHQLKDLDSEIADTLYYLNILAVNRGLTLEDYARMAYDKVKKRMKGSFKP